MATIEREEGRGVRVLPRVAPGAAAVDAALAVAVFVAITVERVRTGSGDAPLWLALGLAAVIAGSLALRRTRPLAGYLLGGAGLVAEALLVEPGTFSPYANLIGLFSLGQYGSRRHALLGPPVALVGIVVYFSQYRQVSVATPVSVLFLWLLAWGAGIGIARRREQAEVSRRLQRRQAILDERTRIARELHDSIGHSVNAMLVQAGAGRLVLDTDPERTRQLLAGVERSGREALEELDRVLGLLRGDDPDLAGAPGLDELDRITRPLADAGMAVTVDLAPAARTLPADVQQAVYRIVQEALTNALRHGRASTARVGVTVDGSVRVSVADDGRGPDGDYRPGRGLTGIAERAAAYGGTVEHGPADGGGFGLRAVLRP